MTPISENHQGGFGFKTLKSCVGLACKVLRSSGLALTLISENPLDAQARNRRFIPSATIMGLSWVFLVFESLLLAKVNVELHLTLISDSTQVEFVSNPRTLKRCDQLVGFTAIHPIRHNYGPILGNFLVLKSLSPAEWNLSLHSSPIDQGFVV